MRHTYTTGSNRNFRQIKLSAIKFTIWTFIAQAPNKPSMRNLIVKSMIEGTKDTIKIIGRKKFTRTTLRCYSSWRFGSRKQLSNQPLIQKLIPPQANHLFTIDPFKPSRKMYISWCLKITVNNITEIRNCCFQSPI